jgi:hypothetical protein
VDTKSASSVDMDNLLVGVFFIFIIVAVFLMFRSFLRWYNEDIEYTMIDFVIALCGAFHDDNEAGARAKELRKTHRKGVIEAQVEDPETGELKTLYFYPVHGSSTSASANTNAVRFHIGGGNRRLTTGPLTNDEREGAISPNAYVSSLQAIGQSQVSANQQTAEGSSTDVVSNTPRAERSSGVTTPSGHSPWQKHHSRERNEISNMQIIIFDSSSADSDDGGRIRAISFERSSLYGADDDHNIDDYMRRHFAGRVGDDNSSSSSSSGNDWDIIRTVHEPVQEVEITGQSAFARSGERKLLRPDDSEEDDSGSDDSGEDNDSEDDVVDDDDDSDVDSDVVDSDVVDSDVVDSDVVDSDVDSDVLDSDVVDDSNSDSDSDDSYLGIVDPRGLPTASFDMYTLSSDSDADSPGDDNAIRDEYSSDDDIGVMRRHAKSPVGAGVASVCAQSEEETTKIEGRNNHKNDYRDYSVAASSDADDHDDDDAI